MFVSFAFLGLGSGEGSYQCMSSSTALQNELKSKEMIILCPYICCSERFNSGPRAFCGGCLGVNQPPNGVGPPMSIAFIRMGRRSPSRVT